MIWLTKIPLENLVFINLEFNKFPNKIYINSNIKATISNIPKI